MSKLRRLGLIGFGSIGRSFVAAWRREPLSGYVLAGVCVRDSQTTEARLATESACVTSDIHKFLSLDLDIVVEAAGHASIKDHAASILRGGRDLYVLSVGAIADRSVQKELEHVTSLPGAGRIAIPSGAVAGLDGLRALRENGLKSVTYTSVKPPRAWLDTPAERETDLRSLSDPATIFIGSARESALLYPKNANLAATIAIAGLGFEKTAVRLVADPAAQGNTGIIEAQSASSCLRVEISGHAFAGNPKSSGIVAQSVIAALKNAVGSTYYV